MNIIFCRQGFEQSQINALLHQIEIGVKHQDENFGLKIILVCQDCLLCFLFVNKNLHESSRV